MADRSSTSLTTHRPAVTGMDPCPEARDRRDYFRIDDDLVLTYQRMAREPESGVMVPASNQELSGFTLKARFAAMEREMRPTLLRLQERSGDVTAYLQMLERKLDMLAEVLLQQEPEAGDRPSQEVNLSAGGLSFQARQPLEAGDLLKLRLLLRPSMIGIETWARVVYCTRLDPGRAGPFHYKVGVEFLNMRDTDTDLVIRHVLCKEAQQRRTRRAEAQRLTGDD